MEKKEILYNYHTHNKLCGHAEGTCVDYVKEAIDKGLSIIGLSDHGHLPNNDPYMDLDSYENIYLKEIEEAKRLYGDKIRIYKGLELEYMDNQDELYKRYTKELDYIILGQHFIMKNNKPVYLGRFMSSDDLLIYRDTVIKALKTGYFKIFAHPDMFFLSYQYKDDVARNVLKDLIESCIENNVYIEINANALRRGIKRYLDGSLDYKYTTDFYLSILSEYKDAKVVVNSDCHMVEFLYDKYVLQAKELVKKYHLNEVEDIFNKENN